VDRWNGKEYRNIDVVLSFIEVVVVGVVVVVLVVVVIVVVVSG